MHACIYLLLCPLSGQVRYVGKTSDELHKRLRAHLSEAKYKNLGHRGSWIRGLMSRGKSPLIVKDVDVPPGECWKQYERDRIAYYRSVGCDLVNGTDGGEGLSNPNDEVRFRMSESASIRCKTDAGLRHLQENGRKGGRLNKGKKKPPHVGAAVSASNKRRTVSIETRMKMGTVRKGRIYSPEHRRKISEGKLRFEQQKRLEANPCP